MLIASAKPNSRPMIPPLEPDTYVARCIQIYDMGVHFDDKFGKEKHRVLLVFEIPDEKVTIEDKEQTRTMWKEYTLSLGDRAELRKALELWRGKPFTEEELLSFDLKNILNTVCLIQVVQRTSKSGNKYSAISGIAKPMKGTTCKPATQEIFAYDMDTADDLPIIETFPKWIREKMKQSLTYQRLSGEIPSEKTGKPESSTDDQFVNINPDELPF